MMKYVTDSLASIVDHFQARADEYKNTAETTKAPGGRKECLVRANVWQEAADILRNTQIVEAAE